MQRESGIKHRKGEQSKKREGKSADEGRDNEGKEPKGGRVLHPILIPDLGRIEATE